MADSALTFKEVHMMGASNRWMCTLLVVALASCGEDGSELSSQTASNADSDVTNSDAAEAADTGGEEISEPETLTAWPEQVISVSAQLDEQLFEGDVADGEALSVKWADEPGVDCWTLIHAAKFSGPQIYYGLSEGLAKSKTLEFALSPADGVDLNLFAYALPIGTYYFPPDVPDVQACISSMSGGPGESEILNLNNLTEPLVWLVAVTSPDTQTSGAFSLTVTRTQN